MSQAQVSPVQPRVEPVDMKSMWLTDPLHDEKLWVDVIRDDRKEIMAVGIGTVGDIRETTLGALYRDYERNLAEGLSEPVALSPAGTYLLYQWLRHH